MWMRGKLSCVKSLTSWPADIVTAAVEIVPYDSAWPEAFRRERSILVPLLEPWLAGPIEHVGSTAVPGLAGKPVIDIMAAVRSLDASRPAIHALASVGYVHFPHRPEQMHWFCKPSPEWRTHHLHLVPHDCELWRSRLAFRDELRRSDMLARQYARLKRQLAGQHRFEREAYTRGKSIFIEQVLTERSGRPRSHK